MTTLVRLPLTARLSPRQQEAVALLAEGLDNKDIAARMFVSRNTVRAHLKEASQVADANNRTHLAIMWLREQPLRSATQLLQEAAAKAGVA